MTQVDRPFICDWNLTYHYGQANYSQLLLADMEIY
jgi:hypothetical protein